MAHLDVLNRTNASGRVNSSRHRVLSERITSPPTVTVLLGRMPSTDTMRHPFRLGLYWWVPGRSFCCCFCFASMSALSVPVTHYIGFVGFRSIHKRAPLPFTLDSSGFVCLCARLFSYFNAWFTSQQHSNVGVSALLYIHKHTQRRPKILFWVSENIDLELARSVRKTEGADENDEGKKAHVVFLWRKKKVRLIHA